LFAVTLEGKTPPKVPLCIVSETQAPTQGTASHSQREDPWQQVIGRKGSGCGEWAVRDWRGCLHLLAWRPVSAHVVYIPGTVRAPRCTVRAVRIGATECPDPSPASPGP